MKSNKSKTIADLSINWVFSSQYKGSLVATQNLEENNPDLAKIKVKSLTYYFKYNDEFKFQITVFKDGLLSNLISFLEEVDFQFRRQRQIANGYSITPLVLDHFELIGTNTFQIHVKE